VALLQRRDVAGIEAERRSDVGVTELSADEVDRHAGGEGERRERVPHLVERGAARRRRVRGPDTRPGAFVPVAIGALTGVRQADAGIASGLINTTQQIGGAIGVAAATTIAITFTDRCVDSHAGTSPLSGAALTPGFQIAFYVLAATAAVGAVLAALLIEPRPAEAEREPEAAEPQLAEASLEPGSAG